MRAHNEAELIALAVQGENRAFDQLVAPHVQRLRRQLRRILINEADVEEVAQIAMTRAWLGLKQFRGGAAFATWLHRVAHNAAMNFLKERNADPLGARQESRHDEKDGGLDAAFSILSDPSTPHSILEAKERSEAFVDALASMPPEMRACIELYYAEGLSYTEIAVRLDTPIGTVRSRLHRARVLLGLLEEDS